MMDVVERVRWDRLQTLFETGGQSVKYVIKTALTNVSAGYLMSSALVTEPQAE